jgi:uncharacterized protein YecE (DUF72 family)
MSIYIGTCGFAYPDWEGFFYPPHMPARDRLAYYAERFPAVELDSMFYQLPAPEVVDKMIRRTRKDFRFTVKAHRSITHDFDLSAAEFGAFHRAVAPIHNSGRLGAALAQFPPAFQCVRDSVQALRLLREEFADLPLAVEFRHRSWLRPETFDFLRKHGIAWCAVDEPALESLLPPTPAITAEFAYVRLHGRNTARWLNARTAAERHNYLYSASEMEEWAARIEGMARETEAVYAMFSNVCRAHAIANARQLADLLGIPLAIPPRRGERARQPELALA